MATWEKVDPDTYNRLIIIKKLLRDEERLLDFLFDPLKAELRASASELLTQMGCFSSGEKIRLQVSLDIWSGEGHTDLSDLLSSLSPYGFGTVLQSLFESQRGLRGQPGRRQLKFPTRPVGCRQ